MNHRVSLVLIASCLALAALPRAADGQRPRALSDGRALKDGRLDALKDLDGYFPFVPPKTAAQWRRRAEEVRRRVLVSQGLWPLPQRTDLRPVIHGKTAFDGYTIEKAYFEALPGFFVTGSLYRPAPGAYQGPRPGVLCPHGHWSQGRFTDAGENGVRQQKKIGAEVADEAARSPLQARCVQLARMGCVVFHYDMIGYADSTQISFELAHQFAKQRPKWNDPRHWGLFSPQAESHLQSVMGLQTWSSIRALDFVSQLPDVDPRRLCVTGASGGGTQTFVLAAVDPRVAVAVPAVMVSTAMQGGCTCENACLLRIGTGNVELAALMAPKPLGLTAADDWTVEMETKGFPQVRQLYRLLGAEERVALWANVQFKHNYNLRSRLPMYAWLNRHLQLGHQEPIEEEPFEFQTREQLTVWDEQHPRPAAGPSLERRVIDWLTSDTQQQLQRLLPEDVRKGEAPAQPNSGGRGSRRAVKLDAWRNVVGPAIDTIVGRDLPDAKDLAYDQTGKEDRDGYVEMVGLLNDTRRGEQSPVLFLYPQQWQGHVVIWLDPQGKVALLDDRGRPRQPVQRLIDAGVAVAGIDLLYQGEFLAGKAAPERTRRVKNPREAAAYTFGYNDSLFARRVHDVLKMVAYVRSHEYAPERVSLVGWEGAAGAWAAAARAQARDLVHSAALHTRGFRFGKVNDAHHPDFLPGGAKYHDLPGMIAVAAPAPVFVAGESDPVVKQVYAAAGGTARQMDEASLKAALDWLLRGVK